MERVLVCDDGCILFDGFGIPFKEELKITGVRREVDRLVKLASLKATSAAHVDDQGDVLVVVEIDTLLSRAESALELRRDELMTVFQVILVQKFFKTLLDLLRDFRSARLDHLQIGLTIQ